MKLFITSTGLYLTDWCHIDSNDSLLPVYELSLKESFCLCSSLRLLATPASLKSHWTSAVYADLSSVLTVSDIIVPWLRRSTAAIAVICWSSNPQLTWHYWTPSSLLTLPWEFFSLQAQQQAIYSDWEIDQLLKAPESSSSDQLVGQPF